MSLFQKSYQLFDRLAVRLGPYIPFSSSYNLWRMLKGVGKSTLDVGCVYGAGMKSINRSHRFTFVVGFDIHRPYLELCKANRTHDHLVLADVRFLPFRSGSFDTAICLEVLEHLEKTEGLKLLECLEGIARSKGILTTPVGHIMSSMPMTIIPIKHIGLSGNRRKCNV